MAVPQIYIVSETPEAQLVQAENVLFLGNALGTDIHLWERAMPALSAHYSIVRFDMPGHGLSPVPTSSYTLEEVADAVVRADRRGKTVVWVPWALAPVTLVFRLLPRWIWRRMPR